MKEKPAFPHQKSDGSPYWGMTFRAYAAVKFMAAIIEVGGSAWVEKGARDHARTAVLNADALIAALTRPNGGSNHGE